VGRVKVTATDKEESGKWNKMAKNEQLFASICPVDELTYLLP